MTFLHISIKISFPSPNWESIGWKRTTRLRLWWLLLISQQSWVSQVLIKIDHISSYFFQLIGSIKGVVELRQTSAHAFRRGRMCDQNPWHPSKTRKHPDDLRCSISSASTEISVFTELGAMVRHVQLKIDLRLLIVAATWYIVWVQVAQNLRANMQCYECQDTWY